MWKQLIIKLDQLVGFVAIFLLARHIPLFYDILSRIPGVTFTFNYNIYEMKDCMHVFYVVGVICAYRYTDEECTHAH